MVETGKTNSLYGGYKLKIKEVMKMTVKQIKERFEIKDDQIITIEIDPSSVEAEEFVSWLNNDSCFDAELTGQCENNVSGDFKEDDFFWKYIVKYAVGRIL